VQRSRRPLPPEHDAPVPASYAQRPEREFVLPEPWDEL
jgi:hypothetical protein